jgi:probable F420-dependent oxidoreductase
VTAGASAIRAAADRLRSLVDAATSARSAAQFERARAAIAGEVARIDPGRGTEVGRMIGARRLAPARLCAVDLGRIGIWRRRMEGTDDLGELEALGYTTFWIGSSPSLAQARQFLERSSTLTIATGILNVWQHEPAAVAAQHAELARDFPDRFMLGIGIGHPEATAEYQAPLAKMIGFFDGLDAAPQPVPREERIAAALGPKMLTLAAERSLGAHPYFVPVEHTRFAREQLGPGPLIATEVAVVVDTDDDRARAAARAYAKLYLGASNYVRNLERLGYTEADIGSGGSDRLIDAVVPHGTPEQIAEVVRAHLDAGADHVCLQPVGHGEAPMEDYRALAAAIF